MEGLLAPVKIKKITSKEQLDNRLTSDNELIVFFCTARYAPSVGNANYYCGYEVYIKISGFTIQQITTVNNETYTRVYTNSTCTWSDLQKLG